MHKFSSTLTSTMLIEELNNVGKALLPTYVSASTLRCSKRSSIVGNLIPTLKIFNIYQNPIKVNCKGIKTKYKKVSPF